MLKIANFTVIISFLLLPLSPALAAEFNPNYVISDDDMTEYSSMGLVDVQNFLERKSSYLANYVTLDTDGSIRRASEIIFRIANLYFINPQFLLALIQKEQSLVEDPAPTEKQLDWAAGYGVCDDCTTDDPAIQRWRGFAKQVRSSAMQFREGYLTDLAQIGRTNAGLAPGEVTVIDGQLVTPVNNATASLYSYTPHLEGNENLWRIWQRWFTLMYPDGSLLQAQGEDGVWLIQYGQKRAFLSKAALLSRYDIGKIISVSQSDLDRYEDGKPIKFANYSLIRSPRGTVFLIDGDNRRGIVSWETFRAIGFNADEIINVTWEDINMYAEGDAITMESVYPSGALLQNKLTGGVYWVQDAKKYPIWSREILKANYPYYTITAVLPAELDKYETQTPAKFRDGELVKAKGDPGVYVVSEGAIRPIPSAEIFERMGYKWENIIETSAKALSLHPIGEPLYLITGEVETAGQ